MKPVITLAIFGFALFQPCLADVSMPAIFSDHMMLQKAAKVPVWGSAAPGEEIDVSVAGQKAHAKADEKGKWRTDLDLSQAGPGPFVMTIQGKNAVTINDVAVGEVWLASGQSNMELVLKVTTGAAQELSLPPNPMVRQFVVVKGQSRTPVADLKGVWKIAGPDAGDFAAVAYYFSKELHKELKVPVGTINSSFGGSRVETWMTQATIDALPDALNLQKTLEAAEAAYPAKLADFRKNYQAAALALYLPWEKEYSRQDKPAAGPENFAVPTVSTADWKPLRLPGMFASAGLPDSGATWIRREVTIPDALTGKSLRMDLGTIHDFTTVYWNGVKIGETLAGTSPGSERRWSYTVPGNLVTPGKAVITVRVFSPRGGAALAADPLGYNFRLVKGNFVLFLAGDWLAKSEYALPAISDAGKLAFPKFPEAPQTINNVPGRMFNAMIAPLVPYGIRGFIWYQGESNAKEAAAYHKAFPALIQDWRTLWGNNDLPFYFCQLPGFGGKTHDPAAASAWAELREAQTAALAVPHTDQAVLIDLGEENELHPRNKRDVGDRLAKIALADTYGKSLPHAGPVFKSLSGEKGALRVQFANTDSGLVARPVPATYQPRLLDPHTAPLVRNSPASQIEGFAICGPDHKWEWADAHIDGSSVVVSSPKVPDPVAVRYAWGDTPTINLYNGDGFPAAPFRTDAAPAR